jgi:hypothetical protein
MFFGTLHDGNSSFVPPCKPRVIPAVLNWPQEWKDKTAGGEHFRIAVALPTRGRVDKAVACLKAAMELASNPSLIMWDVTVDDSDHSVTELKQKLNALPFPVTLSAYANGNKIEACNRLPWGVWDILVSLSDDMVCCCKGWDEEIRKAMASAYPGCDGLLCFHDGYQVGLCTLPVMGRNLLCALQQSVYHREYGSIYADNDLTEQARRLGLAARFSTCLFRHEHPLWTKEQADLLYKKNEQFDNKDRAVWERRLAEGFGLREKPILSVLIPSLTWRHEQFENLLRHLYLQVSWLAEKGSVEILYSVDDGSKSIGGKRNGLLDRARGEYLCFIDDDDWVSDNYLQVVLDAIKTDKPDVVTWWGQYIKDGVPSGFFLHSLDGSRPTPKPLIGRHDFMHLNPIRVEAIAGMRFPALSFAEDQVWTNRIREHGRVKVESFIGGPHYEYRFSSKESSCSAAGGRTWAKG